MVSTVSAYEASGKCPNLGLFAIMLRKMRGWIKIGRKVGENAGGEKSRLEEWDLS